MKTATLFGGLLLVVACRAKVEAPAWQDPTPHRVSFVAVAPGVRLEVVDWGGSGPPLVFLAGLQDVAHGFDLFAPRFTDRFQVIGITRRGYGASSQTPHGYDIATRLADLRAVLDSLGLPRVALVGHSMAGDELTAFAATYPDRVTRLVYLDAIYDHSTVASLFASPLPPLPLTPADSTSPLAVQAYGTRVWGQHIPEAQIRAIAHFDAGGHLIGDVTPASIDSQMLAGAGHPDYASVRAPALVICAIVDSAPQVFHSWATFDDSGRARARSFTALLQSWGAAGRATIKPLMPTAQWVELHGANHYIFDSNEPEVESAMRRFLAEGRP
jgi:pimeloyl-ACP methyl ester carboxylesterase